MSDYNNMWRDSRQNFQSIRILKVITYKAFIIKMANHMFLKIDLGLRTSLRFAASTPAPSLERQSVLLSFIAFQVSTWPRLTALTVV